MEDALLGMDIINRKQINVVSRSQYQKEKLQEQKSCEKMKDCGVIPQDWFGKEN